MSAQLQSLILLCYLILAGCATATPQSDTLNLPDLPKSYSVQNVPFFQQAAGHCGPATLAMVLNWAGKTIDVETLLPLVYTPGMQGSFQQDMVSASRRLGMLAIPIKGMSALIREVSAGHPVIVFENLFLKSWPQWHYAVVYGYDLDKKIVVLHSGLEQSKHWDMRRFEKSWMLGEYWGLVVLPPGHLSAVASELEHMKSASAIESLGFLAEAKISYMKILERWPISLSAHMGLANVAIKQNKSDQALRFLTLATDKHPKSAMAWHNLAILYGQLGQMKKARLSAFRALEHVSDEDKATYLENLKKFIN